MAVSGAVRQPSRSCGAVGRVISAGASIWGAGGALSAVVVRRSRTSAGAAGNAFRGRGIGAGWRGVRVGGVVSAGFALRSVGVGVLLFSAARPIRCVRHHVVTRRLPPTPNRTISPDVTSVPPHSPETVPLVCFNVTHVPQWRMSNVACRKGNNSWVKKLPRDVRRSVTNDSR